MSTLIGIKRTPECGLGPISKAELLEVVGHDASLLIDKDGAPGLSWSGEEKSPGMEFNFQDGEIWSAGTVDDATLRKIQALAVLLQAKLVSEEGDYLDLDALTAITPRSPVTKGNVMFRVYVLLLLIAGVVFYFSQR